MPESWRNILERAATNLSIDLDTRPADEYRRPEPRLTAFDRRRPRTLSAAETRERLARELETISAGPSKAPASIVKPVRRERPAPKLPKVPVAAALLAPNPQPPQPPAGRRRGPGNLTVLAISASVVALACYGIVVLLN